MTANAIRAGWGNYFPDWILTKITNWVRDEIEAKIARAEKRKEERYQWLRKFSSTQVMVEQIQALLEMD